MMKAVAQKILFTFACGTGVLYGAGTLYNVFMSGQMARLEELPGIQVALTLYSAGLIITAFLTLSLNKIGKAFYLSLITVNLFASICMNCMIKLELAADELSRKFFYGCYLFNSFQFMVNEFYVNLMLYDDVPIQYLEIVRTVLIILSVGIPLFIIFFLTRPERKELILKNE